MDTLTVPDANQCYVVIGGQAAAGRLLNLAARLAMRGPLLLLDCGNRANPLPLIRELRRHTLDPVEALGGVSTARAFTCYQVAAMLEAAVSWPVPHPVLVVDLLATFYDESVTHREAHRLLEQAVGCVTKLRAAAPVVISARPPLAAFPERAGLIDMVTRLADVLWLEETTPPAQTWQLSFFG